MNEEYDYSEDQALMNLAEDVERLRFLLHEAVEVLEEYAKESTRGEKAQSMLDKIKRSKYGYQS